MSVLNIFMTLWFLLVADASSQSNVSDVTRTPDRRVSGGFKPPTVFKNLNLARNVDLEKSYVRESITVEVQNIDEKKESQDEYYLPFAADAEGTLGSFEVRNKDNPDAEPFDTELVEIRNPSTNLYTHFYVARLPEPLKPKSKITLSISFTVSGSLVPLPATVGQSDRQFLKYSLSAFAPSAYDTEKQRTRLKLPTADIPDYDKVSLPSENFKGVGSQNDEDPVKMGSQMTYGPFDDVPALAYEPVSVRYEFNKPLPHVSSLERDLEVSHWGGNLATEERYHSLSNRAAGLKDHFNRVAWAQAQYLGAASHAMRNLNIPLRAGAANPYFIDDIGNVSTSKFRPSANPKKTAMLELKPRFPLFGDWNYKFKIGWDRDLDTVVRRAPPGDGSSSDKYIMKVPFLEGPKTQEGVSYGSVTLSILLPEGAKLLSFDSPIPVRSSQSSYHTFFDTIGRTRLTLRAENLVDDLAAPAIATANSRQSDLYIEYEYSLSSHFRKPLVILSGILSVFVLAWAVSKVDTRIGGVKVVDEVKKTN
ncbi:MAG: dolichyl-diphosphooligosaccharide--protein glycosyltransferase subunit 1 [Alyxoria varia]|nr:MAG: dolichyl-diphosphooligosaccharide--protein glycosyltransferase subunit 1 [Alyxoria varia]